MAAALGVAALLPATAGAATLRVVTPTKTVFGSTATQVGSARSYVDSKGHVHKLKRHTALGQLVAAAAYTGTALNAVYYPEYGSAVITRIDGVAAPKTGYWELFVNGYPSQIGAADVILKKTDSVVWIADDDYSVNDGPFVYDLRSKTNADGTVTFTGWRIGGSKPIPATGQRLIVNGALTAPLDAKGKLTLAVSHPWTASIGERGNIVGSEALTG
ncbi:MAG: DUF4430 domain-containing protein [Gaiellales bacterium]